MPSYSLLSLATLLAALPAAQATWEHYVTVGKHGNEFEPPYVHAHVGAKIKFQFFPKNHTVTQAPFDQPCTAQPWGIDSGFQSVADIYSTTWYEFEVKEDKPTWFYSQQGDQCSKDGMVFAVNPPSSGDKTFEAFQTLAKKQTQQVSSAAATTEHQGSEPPSYGHWDANGEPAPPHQANTDTDSTLSGSASTGGNSFSAISGALESDAAESSGSAFGKWAPIVIGLLAGNLLISLILVALNIMGYIRRGGRESGGGSTTRSAPSYAPVRVMEQGRFPSEGASYSDNEAGKRYSD